MMLPVIRMHADIGQQIDGRLEHIELFARAQPVKTVPLLTAGQSLTEAALCNRSPQRHMAGLTVFIPSHKHGVVVLRTFIQQMGVGKGRHHLRVDLPGLGAAEHFRAQEVGPVIQHDAGEVRRHEGRDQGLGDVAAAEDIDLAGLQELFAVIGFAAHCLLDRTVAQGGGVAQVQPHSIFFGAVIEILLEFYRVAALLGVLVVPDIAPDGDPLPLEVPLPLAPGFFQGLPTGAQP